MSGKGSVCNEDRTFLPQADGQSCPDHCTRTDKADLSGGCMLSGTDSALRAFCHGEKAVFCRVCKKICRTSQKGTETDRPEG